MAGLSEQGIRLSSMSPSFLNSNSTSHTWPFSAVAELLDNASDPGVSAKQFWIDVEKEGDHLTLTFTDNGSGMTPNKLHKMLSFGFTDKGSSKASQQAIGVYGNGFKSGSMRLGRDALIFTKNGGCQTVGMLSQTYLENIKAQAVIVPIVPFNQLTKCLVVTEDSQASLAAILQHSILTSREQIDAHFDSILSKKGTKILIWNIRRAKDGKSEIDFETDESDFRLPEIQIEELRKGLRHSGSLRAEHNIPDMHYSLRAYLSILYLKPRTQIILRGKKILAQLVSKRLTHIENDVYKPHFSKEKVKVTFGLNPKNKEHYGIMMYHKNRLIKAYEKVGCQLKTSGQRAGLGVIGIIECNFLKPAHSKQDFEYTKEYRLTHGALGLKLNDYWKDLTEKRAREREFMALNRDDTDDSVSRGPMWLQCEECLKWRSIPRGYYKVAPESWNCSKNPNPRYRSCSSPEEADDSEEMLTPSYQKNHKKQEPHKIRQREKSTETRESKNERAKHQTLSHSSPEEVRTTIEPTREHTAIKNHSHTEKYEETTTEDVSDHHEDTNPEPVAVTAHRQETPAEKDTVSEYKKKQQTEKSETEDQRLEDDESGKKTDEGGEEHSNTFSLKRKSESSLYYVIKKKRHFLGKQTDPLKSPDKDKTHSSRLESSHPPRDHVTGLSWTQTAEEPQTGLQTEDGGDREAKVERLAMLEEKVQKLRSLLGLEVTRTSRGTMTTSEGSAETSKPKSAPADSREVCCQTDSAGFSSSSTSPTLTVEHQALVVCGHTIPCESKNQGEQNGARREKTTDGLRGCDTCEDSRSAVESLREVRSSVVLLLTALLPQLDLTGISLETTDVDHILQQIIEVNALRM